MNTMISLKQFRITQAAARFTAAAVCALTGAFLAVSPVHAETAEEALAAVMADAAAQAAAPAIAAPSELPVPAAAVPAELPAPAEAPVPAEATAPADPAAPSAAAVPPVLTESGSAQIAPGIWLTAYNYPQLVPATAEALAAQRQSPLWAGPVLTKNAGSVQGPSGKEVYYNLDMAVIVDKMRKLGFEADYWVRADGVKMFGPFVMVAAGYDVHPLGSLVETSVGTAMVVDTGGFASSNPYLIDIATVW